MSQIILLKKKLIFISILSFSVILPVIVLAESETLNNLLATVTDLLNKVIALLFVLATVYFLWGVVQYVVGAGGKEEQLKQGKQHMLWGIIGMAIMLSAWGIVEGITTFFLGI